jgi:hypothetical protein
MFDPRIFGFKGVEIPKGYPSLNRKHNIKVKSLIKKRKVTLHE